MPDFSQFLQLGQHVQGRITQMQTELAQRTVMGAAGGGMVEAVADGRGRIRRLKIDPSVFSGGDVEMLEDLIVAAVSDAQRRAEELYKEELRKVTGGLPFPFQLPL